MMRSRRRSGSALVGRRQRLALGLLAMALLLGCQSEKAAPWNVVMVMVDTLRADRMSLYGAGRKTTPNLDRLAERAVVFESATSDAGCTFPSVNSIFTARWPHRQLERLDEVGMAIPEDVPTLAEVLGRNGYDTAAVSSSIVVRKTPSAINFQGGFDAGFGAFDETCLERGAPCVNRQAFEQLGRLREPFFLYLHYLEPHAPYRPPKWFEKEIQIPKDVRPWARRGELQPLFAHLYEDRDVARIGQVEIDLLAELYDEEIRFFDDQFLALMSELKQRGLTERTVVVLLSDHGEELMEHGHAGHCRDLAFETLMHVPLVIWIPGGESSGRRRSLAQNVDLMPTLLDLLEIDPSGLAMDGLSLRPTIESDEPVRRFASSLQGTARTLRTERWKLIQDLELGRHWLYDMENDPAETFDLGADRPDLARDLTQTLERLLERIETKDAVEKADQVEEQLKRLGYL